MRLSREKVIRLSHQITDVLVASDDVEFIEDRATIRMRATQGESGRRLSVGRSSSPLSVPVVPVFCLSFCCSVLVRSVGLPGPFSWALRLNIMPRSRAFT